MPAASTLSAAARARARVTALGQGARRRAALLAPLATAALVAGLVFTQSYRRHVWFGSCGKDLGLFHQSIWLLSRGEAPHNTVMGMHAFADHLELFDLAVAPLMWLWPSAAALLFVQALLVAAGAAAVVDLARARLGSTSAGVLLGLAFVLGVDMQNAVMFDWNPTTCGAGLLPVVAWAFARRRVTLFLITLVVVASCKENLVLYAAFTCAALALASFTSDADGGPAGGAAATMRRTAALAAVALLALFVLEVRVLVPLFRDGGYRHWRYEQLGADPVAVVAAALAHPLEAARLAVTPSDKLVAWATPLLSFALLPLVGAEYLIAIVPMLLERLWSTHANRWWGYHYGAGVGAIAAVAAIDGLARLRRLTRRAEVARFGPALVLACAVGVGFVAHSGTPPLLRSAQGYADASSRAATERALAVIPPAASVAAQNHLLAHLGARRELYELRRPVTAEYVAINLRQGAWPFADSYPLELARELVASGYGVAACDGPAVILARDAPRQACDALR